MRNTRAHAAATPQNDLHLLTHPGIWLCAVAAAFAMTTAHAQSTPDDLSPPSNATSLSPKQAYEHDRAYCNSGQATESRSLCLKEAARAYHDDLAGRLDRSDTGSANTSGTGTDSDRWNGRRTHRDDRH